METIKYIIKRLLLSLLILFGVSVIIYGLARMMPTDFVDQQFQGAISQGTMKQEDLDRIKELYGLNMPDAYLEFTPGDGSMYSGEKFTRNTKEVVFEEDVLLGGISYAEWYAGSYYGSGNHQIKFSEPNEVVILLDGGSEVKCTLNKSANRLAIGNNAGIQQGEYRPQNSGADTMLETTWTFDDGTTDYVLALSRGVAVYTSVNGVTGETSTPKEFPYTYRGVVELGEGVQRVVGEEGEGEDDGEITIVEDFEVKETGTYRLAFSDEWRKTDDNGHLVIDRNATRQLAVTMTMGSEFNVKTYSMNVKYRKANFWDKTGSVLKSYFNWLGNMLKGDLGTSFKYKRPVADVILDNMGISFAIAFIATVLQFLIAIPLGIKAAVNQYGFVDYTVTIFTMIGISLPTFFLGALFIRVFAVGLGWFEVGGLMSASLAGSGASWIVRLGDMLWHMIMPMAVLVILSIGGLMRYTRTNTLEALNADYVRTARAKGLSEKTVIYKHAFRNTLVPLVTLLAGTLPSLFGGAMITETVFAIPGIGKLAYDALVVADVPFIMGYNMFLAVMTVLGTLFSDLMYAVVDPRVKIGK